MKFCCALVLFMATLPAFGLQGGTQKATVQSMHKVPCFQMLPQMPSAYPAMMPAGDCVQYELQTEKVSYIIRPRHEVLLQLGGEVMIRLAQSELLLRTSDSVKEIRCDVLSMSLRSEAERRDRKRPLTTYCIDERGRPVNCPADMQ